MIPLTQDHPLSQTLLEHLHRELAALELQREVFQEVYTALLGHDAAQFERAVARQEQAAADTAQMADARQNLVFQVAARLQWLPEQVTLSRLAAESEPELGELLSERQQRLQTVAAEVVYLQQRNALVIQRSAELFEHLMAQLTGAQDDGQSYTASGHLVRSSNVTLVEAEC